jgi:hypothetical protein
MKLKIGFCSTTEAVEDTLFSCNADRMFLCTYLIYYLLQKVFCKQRSIFGLNKVDNVVSFVRGVFEVYRSWRDL